MAGFKRDANGNIIVKKSSVTGVSQPSADGKDRTWFQKGTYEDGYKYGDLHVGIGGTVVDILGNVAQGVGNFGEGVSDLGLYIGAEVADLLGFDSFAKENKKKAQKNTVNDFFDKYINPTTDKDSFLGEKSDSLAQNVGYVLPSVGVSVVAPHLGLGAVGTSALTTGGTFAASMGGGMSEAYNAGATDSEAWKYGFSSGLIEAGTELMFGGLGGGARTLGLTSGIGGLDDILANKLTSKLKSRVAKTLVKAGIKATGEGVEEVAAGYLSALAKKHTYASEKELDELIEDENLLESFIGGAFVGGVFQVGNVTSSIKTGRDIITGFTSREEAVVDALYNETVNNAKAKGQELSKSDLAKIRKQSEEAVRNGEVSVELIEKTLGGEAQKGLDALSAEADEFDKLYKTPGGELSREQQNRLNELEAKNKERSFEERKKEARQGLRQSVRDASAKDQYIGRAYVEEGKKYKAYSVNAKEYSGKGRAVVENAMKAGFLNDSSNTHRFVDLVAKLATEKGIEFDFTSNEKLKNSGFAMGGRVINGFEHGGKISVNMNAAKALNSVVGHEITHVLEGTELYNELKTALFRYAQGKKDYDGRRKTLEELYKDVKGADVDAELMADLVGDYLFTDEAFIRRLSTENRSLFEKIFDEIKYLARLATAGSKEARELERAKRLFERVYKETDARKADGTRFSLEYQNAAENPDILNLVEKVESGNFKANDKVDLGNVSPDIAEEIQALTGVNVDGFKVSIEARQIDHILKDHGKNGKSDKSMSNPSDIAKIEFAIENHEDLIPAGKTQAYTQMVNGKNRTVDTVLYEKAIGEKAYYVVQAVPETKAKTLYIVTAFIGKKGYKKEGSQLINANSPDATSKNGSANTSNKSIPQNSEKSRGNAKFSLSKENASAPIAPLPGYNVRGEDIALKTAPLAKNTDGVANTKAAANSSAEGKNQPSASGGSLEINELRDEITNLRARLDEVKAQRDEKISGYQQTIDNKQEQYDSKANKNTKTASNLLASIERNTELRDKAAVKFDEQIRKLESELQDDIDQLMNEEETARLTHEPVTSEEKQRSFWSYVKELVLDKGMVFETLGKKHGNRSLEAKWNQTRLAEPMAQHFIQNGVEGYDSINDVRKKLNAAGTSDDFELYMYHLHNSDRMRLAERAKVKAEDMKASDELLAQLTQIEGAKYADARALIEATREAVSMRPLDIGTKTKELWKKYKEYNALLEIEDKPVFGKTVTAEISDAEAARLLSEHPEFKEYADAIYANTKALRQMLVDSGIISQDAANMWDEMYPHYVPIKRDKTNGSAVSVPLDSRRTGVNVPVKKATGGNSDIGYLFSTLAERTEQTFSAVARNEFGKELRKVLALEGMTDLPGVLPEGDTGEGLDTVANLSDLEKTEGGEYSFTVFEGGKRRTFEVTEEMYDALKPRNKFFSTKIPLLGKISTWQRNVLTQYNPVFWMTNFIKDAQDVVWNSQHAGATYKTMMALMADAVATKGKKYFTGDAVKKYQSYIDEYAEHGGEGVTYFDRSTKAYVDEVSDIGHRVINAIVSINEAVERLPRLAEYIASREAGRSIEESMLDASRVTTNFQAGGDLTKWLNKNGFTFLNASVQGAVQSARNVREAYMEGAVKGTIVLAAKLATLGLPALILNALKWKDDEEYEQLSDYVKDNYYVIWKNDDGTFIRIPKGRMAAVISDLFEQVANGISGEGADFGNTAQLAISNLAPNNPIENNVLAPLIQAYGNTTWYGDDLIPSRLQNLPREEQYDESTDTISVLLGRSFVGKVLNLSPYQINYLLNQYSGGIGDFAIPMLTPEVESRTNWAIAPFADKFTTNANFNSQYVSDFYDTMDELTKAAQSMNATDEDTLRYKYFLSQNSKLSELYKQKRELQAVPSKELSDKEKYNAVYDIQEQINKITKEALDSYQDVVIDRKYATVGDVGYYWYEPSEDAESAEPGWHKISDKQLIKQDKVCSEFDISAAEYWNNREELNYAYDYPARYLVSQFSGGYETYRAHMKVINDIESDKDENGETISGSRKKKVLAYILSAKDLDANEKMILYRSLYSDSQYNRAIVDYLAKRSDVSYENKLKLLEALGFKVGANGVYW